MHIFMIKKGQFVVRNILHLIQKNEVNALWFPQKMGDPDYLPCMFFTESVSLFNGI